MRLGAWIGIGTSPGGLITGGGIAASIGRPWQVPAAVLGAMLLATLAVLTANRGWALRETTVELARRTFGGAGGERVVAVLITLGVCGWGGLYVGLSAGAMQELWGWPTIVTSALLGSILFALYRTGFKRWNLMVAVTGLAAIAVALMVAAGVDVTEGATAAPRFEGPTGLLFGVGIVVAFGAVFALRAADFTWDARAGSDSIRAGAVMAVAMVVFLLLGVSIYHRAGSFDLSSLVTQTRLPVVGALLLSTSAIAPAVSGLHSGALSLHRLLGWREEFGAATVALAGASLGAGRFDLKLLGFLSLLGAVMPPLIGVILLRDERNRDWHAWAAWVAGSAAALGLLFGGYPIHVLVGVVISGLTVIILGRLTTTDGKPT